MAAKTSRSMLEKAKRPEDFSAEHIQLVPEHQDFGFQLGPRPKRA
jgi:hypothetical protein